MFKKTHILLFFVLFISFLGFTYKNSEFRRFQRFSKSIKIAVIASYIWLTLSISTDAKANGSIFIFWSLGIFTYVF